jgi:hypothetical protein
MRRRRSLSECCCHRDLHRGLRQPCDRGRISPAVQTSAIAFRLISVTANSCSPLARETRPCTLLRWMVPLWWIVAIDWRPSKGHIRRVAVAKSKGTRSRLSLLRMRHAPGGGSFRPRATPPWANFKTFRLYAGNCCTTSPKGSQGQREATRRPRFKRRTWGTRHGKPVCFVTAHLRALL